MATPGNCIDVSACLEATVVRQCPITSGRPTRMLKATFERLCAQKRQGGRTDFGEKKAPAWCAKCRGKNIPVEIEFINEDQLERLAITTNTKEQEMAKRPQACDGCGKTKMLSNCSGDLLCSSCAATAGSISNRPDVVAKMIVKRGQTEAILGAMGVGQVVAATVDSELLQKLSVLVGYEGESGDELFAALSSAVVGGQVARSVNEEHIEFLVEIRDILQQPDCPIVELIEEVRVGLACREAVEKVADALCLPDEFTNDQVVDSVSDLLAALTSDQHSKVQDQYKAELVVATTAIAEICRPLGLDPADKNLQYKDIAIAVAQTAAVLENLVRSSRAAVESPEVALPPLDLVEQLTDELGVHSWVDIVQSVKRLRGDLADIKRAKNILDEQWDTVAVALEADSFAAEDVLAAVNKLTAKANNLQYRLNATSDQAAEAEQRLLADEQVFARIREVIDGDGVTNGDLPTVIEQMVRRVGGAPLRLKRPEIDSHLLDLLVEFPQIGVERIAVLREAA